MVVLFYHTYFVFCRPESYTDAEISKWREGKTLYSNFIQANGNMFFVS